MSLYLALVVLTGTLFYPEKWFYFQKNWQLGKNSSKFYDADFELILKTPTQNLRNNFGIKNQNRIDQKSLIELS